MSTVTTVADLAGRVHRLVKGSRRELVNYLDAAVDADDTTITFEDFPDGITEGTYLGIDEEIVYVRSVNVASKQATVRRARFNSSAASHADVSEVEVNWRWFTADVIDAIADEVRSWPDDIFQVREEEVSVGTSSRAVDLPLSGYRFPLRLRRSVTGSDSFRDVTESYRVDVNLPTSEFSSGNALVLPTTVLGSGTVVLEYAADFDVDIIGRATLIDDIGISQTLVDAAIYGAAARLLIEREPQRSAVESQPEPRQAADVRAGQALQTGAAFRQLADLRIMDEATRLRARYPIRML